jgi:Holliday junction resolvasome RuvABC endonuclease subunit
MKNPIVLGVDCGLSSGYAVVEGGELKSFGLLQYKKTSRGIGGVWSKFKEDIKRIIKANDVSVIYYEKPHLRGYLSTENLINMTGRIKELAYELNLPCFGVHSATLKKSFTGSGRAKKEDMIRKAKFYSHTIEDHNIADAIGLAFFGYNKELETWKK